MQNQFVRALLPRVSKTAPVQAILVTIACIFSITANADPVLYAGSIYQINDVATVYGAGFNAGDQAVVKIVTPAGDSANTTVVANAEGMITLSLVLQDEGTYSATLMNSAGEAVVSISLLAN